MYPTTSRMSKHTHFNGNLRTAAHEIGTNLKNKYDRTFKYLNSAYDVAKTMYQHHNTGSYSAKDYYDILAKTFHLPALDSNIPMNILKGIWNLGRPEGSSLIIDPRDYAEGEAGLPSTLQNIVGAMRPREPVGSMRELVNFSAERPEMRLPEGAVGMKRELPHSTVAGGTDMGKRARPDVTTQEVGMRPVG